MSFPVRRGNRERWSFSRIDEILEMPDLIEIQKNSYKWFLESGLRRCLTTFHPFKILPATWCWNCQLFFGEPNHSVEACKEKDMTYSVPLRVKVRLINQETGEVKEQEVFMGDFR